MNHKSKKITSLLFLFLLFFFSKTSHSQNQNIIEIDRLLSSTYKAEAPGASVLIAKSGSIIFQEQYGLSSLEYQLPIDKRTKFDIASITKQFTATAILLLEEQGKLKTSDYLGSYLTDFDLKTHPIRLKHLLTHTSGIPSDNSNKEVSAGLRREISPEEILDIIKTEPLLFEPGTEYDYSNNGYILLGLVIEKVSEMTYEAFLQKHIFGPFMMQDTQVGFYQDVVLNRASGYDVNDDGQPINASYLAPFFSAGGIISTPTDLFKWTHALFGLKVIDKQSLSRMLQSYKLKDGKETNEGFGWEVNRVQTALSYEYSGAQPGYKSNSIYLPEEEMHIIVMQNTQAGSPVPVAINLAAIMLGKPYPNPSESVKVSEEVLTRFIGTYSLENNSERIIGINNNGGLYIKSKGGRETNLYVLNENTLFYKKGYRQLYFDDNSTIGYKTFKYTSRINQAFGTKLTNSVTKLSVTKTLAISEMKKFVGNYTTQQFELTISLENDKLFIQPKGSDKLELLFTDQGVFVVKEIGAEVKFVAHEGKEINMINIVIDGNEMNGIKQ